MSVRDFLRLDIGLRVLLAPALAAMLAVAWTGPSAWAEGNAIAARYELVSTAELEDGTTVATLQITFTNDSDTDFIDATVRLFGDGAMLDDEAAVAIGSFWGGDSVSRNVELRFYGPVELDFGLTLYGEVAEVDGPVVTVPVTLSEGGANQ